MGYDGDPNDAQILATLASRNAGRILSGLVLFNLRGRFGAATRDAGGDCPRRRELSGNVGPHPAWI